jgi:hypothetical protein
MEGDFRVLAELLAAQAQPEPEAAEPDPEPAEDRPTEQLGLF